VTLVRPRNRPCPTCPYRKDVPSGIWKADEYEKLPRYDGDVPEQVQAGAFGLFHCHQQQNHLCAGWVGCHDMANNLAVRFSRRDLDMPAVLGYISPVPLFTSGAKAAAHGVKDIRAQSPAARRKVAGLLRVAQVRNRRPQLPGEDQS
jgi:Family of unknown function (DUF6283)